MSNKEVVVSDVSKQHENPIAELVQVACQFDSNIHLENNNRKINAKSIMGIMAFNPTEGMTVNILAEGTDEEEAIVAIEAATTVKPKAEVEIVDNAVEIAFKGSASKLEKSNLKASPDIRSEMDCRVATILFRLTSTESKTV